MRAAPRWWQVATASEVDTVISAIVGVAGLEATYAAMRAGKRVGLANKEVLVSGGKLVMDAVRASGAELIPVDSEHNGAHQCLRAGNRGEVTKLILTASGGPFRTTPVEQFASSDTGRRFEASNMEDGESHHHRFGHADEQGLRGDRGLLAVRFRTRRKWRWWFIRNLRCTPWSNTAMAA